MRTGYSNVILMKMKTVIERSLLGLLLALGGSSTLYAEEEAEAIVQTAQYIHFEPAFVVNFGTTGRIKYLRTDVAVKVMSQEAFEKVTQHKPYIRNNLVALFSAQEVSTVNSSAGREAMRKLAVDEIRELMRMLEGVPHVEDVFFKSFVVQN